MAELTLKQQFVRLMRDILRNSRMTRVELIDRLGVSSSTMSQMLNGDLVPNIQRLDSIIELLHPAAEDAEKLQYMVLWLRMGSIHCPSEFNRRLFMARCENALTIEQLAAATTIPVRRLRRLERTAYAEPTPDELMTLSSILGRPLKDDMFISDMRLDAAAPLEVAESSTSMLPQITADCLEKYSADRKFGHFVADNCVGFYPFQSLPAEAMALVRAPAARFHVALPGELMLVLGQERPRGFARLDLCRLPRGRGLFVAGDAALYGDLLAEGNAVRSRASWRLPVLQLIHIPEDRGNGKS